MMGGAGARLRRLHFSWPFCMIRSVVTIGRHRSPTVLQSTGPAEPCPALDVRGIREL